MASFPVVLSIAGARRAGYYKLQAISLQPISLVKWSETLLNQTFFKLLSYRIRKSYMDQF